MFMTHTVRLKINKDFLLRYGQNRTPWPMLAKHLWPIPTKDVARCKVEINLFHVRSTLR